MNGSLTEQLTANFYLWEERGRGWTVWDHPVELEPPFEPFGYYFIPIGRQIIDDGKKPTFLSNLVDKLKRIGSPSQGNQNFPDTLTWTPYPLEADRFVDRSPLRFITITLTSDEAINSERAQQFLLTLSLLRLPVSFEVCGTAQSITVQFTVREGDLPQLQQQLQAYFPDISMETRKDAVLQIERDAENTVVVDFGLSEEFMRPLRMATHFEPDPLTGLIAALEQLRENELGVLQVVFQATKHPWVGSILQSVSDGEGGSFFADSPEMLRLAQEKVKQPLYAVIIRVIGAGNSEERAWDIVRGISSGLIHLTDPQSNELIPLANDNYDPRDHVEDVLKRTSHRTGMVLNCTELASLVHPPSGLIQSPKLLRHLTKTRCAPRSVDGHSLLLGENVHHGKATDVSLGVRQRLNHIHIIGATGTGKSTLLQNMIIQDIEQGCGLAVVDPHGDLIERIISSVPRKRLRDVVLFDPSDAENPLGINILSAKSEAEKNVAASDLIAVFRRMATTWGDQMSVVLGNAIQAFLESERGGTLVDLRKFLIEEDFQKEFLRSVRDKDVRYFWEKQHHLLRGATVGSILTRLDTFLRPKIVRNVVAPNVDLRLDNVLNEQRILLVKLAQGLIGEENSTLLGTLIVSKLHQTAMARQALKADERTPFFLYIDEFQNFITPSLAGVLSGTRKYGLGLVLAHQELRQIFNQDTGVANSVISNPGTRICFRLGDFDAQKLADGFAHFTAQDLQNLGVGEAIVRVEKSDDDFNLKVFPPRTVIPETAKARKKRIIELSHTGYRAEDMERTSRSEDAEEADDEVPTEVPLPPPREPPKYREEALQQSKRPAIATEVVEEPSLSQHRYLQSLIKRMAEDRGYRAIIEKPTPDGEGRIDVSVERDEVMIAFEISITTTDEQEIHNIHKCVAAGYGKVIACSPEKRRLEKIRALASKKLTSEEQAKVFFFEPDFLVSFFNDLVPPTVNKEERVKGFRVKVQYQSTDEVGNQLKRDTMAKIILESVRRLKEERVPK